MKEENDMLKKFRDSFSQMDGHFHVLEQRVPVERQMEYFKYSKQFRKDPGRFAGMEMDFPMFEASLSDPAQTAEDKRYILCLLATSRQVKAYRILKEYAQAPDPEVADWAYMALMEIRIALESELSDEKQIYISTGLGGRGEKLRFYVLLLSNGLKPFLEYQRRVIEREFPYSLEQADCEIERLTVGERHVELLLLIPVRGDIKQILDRVIDECNQYGNFLTRNFTITNVKELSAEEVEQIIERNGEDNQASH